MQHIINKSMVTIIIPVYNAAEHLADTIKSIQNQVYSNWTLVLVDDCSIDQSLDICNRFANGDARIKILKNAKNSGPAVTRNNGIEYAISIKSEYIGFVDSDDLVSPYYLEKMVSVAEEHNADIVWCNYWEYNYWDATSKHLMSHGLTANKDVDGVELLHLFFGSSTGLGSLCNKLYKVEFVTHYGVRINPERVRAEDWEFNLTLFQKGPKVTPIEDALYNYIHYTKRSVMSTYRPNDYEMFWRSRTLLKKMASDNNIVFDREKEDSTLLYHIINQLQILSMADNVKDKNHYFQMIINDSRLHDLLKNGCWKYKALPHTFKVAALLLNIGCVTLLKYYLRIR